jgi:NAD(P)-dependent dehydrogenase (short-subunit alcohol dehydrogenase family)
MNDSFKNKNVLVSGAGKGIGKEIVLSFARSGADVVFFDKDKEKVASVKEEIQKVRDGNKLYAEVFDITKINKIEEFLKRVKTEIGDIDILINNVGVGLVRRFQHTKEADFDFVFSTGLKGPFFLTQKVTEKMREGGNVIFITSIHAKHPSLDPTYDTSKAAINNLVLNLSLELAHRQIRVNAIAPGHIDIETENKPRKQSDVPLGKKAGLPQDIANASLFLADQTKASYITGVVLPVTGGLHIPIAKDLKF